MRAGQLDELIEIQYESGTAQDPNSGQPIPNWLPLVVLPGSPAVAAPFWAQWQDDIGRSESVQQGLVVARNQSRVRFRYRSDVNSAMRIVRKRTAETYQIVGGPSIIGRFQWTQVMVERTSS